MSRKRRILIGSLIVLLVLPIVLVASVPLWFPWLARPLAPKFGAKYARYERTGYGRFRLHEVTYTNQSVSVFLQHVEAFVPTAWAWNRYFREPSSNVFFVSAGSWRAEVLPSAIPKDESRTNALPQAWEKLQSSLAKLDPWIPRAELTNGVLRLKDVEIDLPIVTWENRRLSAEAFSGQYEQQAQLQVDLPRTGSGKAELEIQPFDLSLSAQLQPTNDTVAIDTVVWWRGSRYNAAASFGRAAWIPLDASLDASTFSIPARFVHLDGYRNVSGSITAAWRNEQFHLGLEAAAEPEPDSDPLRFPPASAIVRAQGDRRHANLAELVLRVPWGNIELAKPARIDLKNRQVLDPTVLRLEARLEEQPWTQATGTISGTVTLEPSESAWPNARVQLQGDQIVMRQIVTERFSFTSTVLYPLIAIDTARIEFPDRARIELRGRMNLATRQLQAVEIDVSGPLGRALLSTNISFETLQAHLQAGGSFTNIAHRGEFNLTALSTAQLRPLNLSGQWEGAQLALGELQLHAINTNAAVHLAGRAHVTPGGVEAELGELDLEIATTNALSLKQPVQIRLQKGVPPEAPGWQAEISRFQWHGPQSRIAFEGKVQWPVAGQIDASVRNLDPTWITNFLSIPAAPAQVSQLDFFGRWSNSPLDFILSATASYSPRPDLPLAARVNLKGGAEGLAIDQFLVSTGPDIALTGEGFLPGLIHLSGTNELFQYLPDRPFRLAAETRPITAFWDQLAQWTHVGLVHPLLQLELGGTARAPEGRVTFDARAIHLLPKEGESGPKLPRVENLSAILRLDREFLALEKLDLSLQEQPIQITAELPLPKNLSVEWREVLDWKNARAHLQLPSASLAALAEFAPQYLAPQGELRADVRIEPGANFQGTITLTNAATRPLAPIGPLQDLALRLGLAGRSLEFEQASALIGGERISVTGEVDVSDESLAAGLPWFELIARGTNVPLARRPDVVLRSDLNLTVSHRRTPGTEPPPPLVSGEVQLQDSLFLSELRALIPGRVAAPAKRPPYFSVSAPPFDTWRLDLKVRGTEFMAIRSPLFRGQVSANFDLTGTLKEPVALGDATINSGLIQFPFGNLEVQQGYVTLTSDEPYRPRVFVVAANRMFGYDVRMEAHGPADQLVVEFSSMPPLRSEQIVLMLTAGELPKDELRFTSQQKAGRIAMFLGRNLWSQISGNESEQRLVIRSGEDITEQGRPTYSVEYKLTDDWSIVAEYDRFNALNAGLKWKLYSK